MVGFKQGVAIEKGLTVCKKFLVRLFQPDICLWQELEHPHSLELRGVYANECRSFPKCGYLFSVKVSDYSDDDGDTVSRHIRKAGP